MGHRTTGTDRIYLTGGLPGSPAEWDGPAGEHRIRHAELLDAEVRPHNERFRATLTKHDTSSGVFFDSRAWIITARHR